VALELKLATAWQESDAEGTYRLRLQSQPTVRPTAATVTIRVPTGMHISFASQPLTVDGDSATWTGQLSDVTDLEVRFERGFLGRMWTNIQDFLSKPVIKL
jgi:hypothetical protein